MRFLKLASLSALFFAAPACAQFGVAGGNRGRQGDFQDLQKRAAAAAGGGGAAGGADAMNDIYKMMGDAFNDPEMMKQYEQAMEEMAKMSPDELQQQMAQALNELTNDDMLAEILKQKESVIQNLQMTGAVDAEELARYRTDDAYFELKMRESFGEMQQMFNNPDYLKVASEAMGTVADSLQHPEKVFEGVAKMAGSLTDDDIEESRLRFLKGDFASDPFLGKAFDSPEMKEILQDAGKWRNAVKQGYEDVVKAGGSSMKDEL